MARFRSTAAIATLAAAFIAMVAAATTAWPCVALASLEITPSTTRAGEQVEFRGAYYNDAEPVVLRLGSLDGPVLATVAAAALVDFGHGHWREVMGSFLIPADTPSGRHVVLATQSDANGKPTWGIPARTVVHVVGGRASQADTGPGPLAAERPRLFRLEVGRPPVRLPVVLLLAAGGGGLGAGMMALVAPSSRSARARRSG